MQARADISLYPLANDYIPPIRDVIARLNAHEDLTVITNDMSTQVTGEYDALMAALQQEMRTSFERDGKCVFIVKFLPL